MEQKVKNPHRTQAISWRDGAEKEEVVALEAKVADLETKLKHAQGEEVVHLTNNELNE